MKINNKIKLIVGLIGAIVFAINGSRSVEENNVAGVIWYIFMILLWIYNIGKD